MPKKPARTHRFQLLGPVPGSDYILPKALDSPGAVLSKALNEAARTKEPGVWEVWEWDDLIYRVHRLEHPQNKLDVRVEVMR